MKQIKSALNGKDINLTGDNTIISSTNFNVDKNGNMTCKNANVSGTITSSDANITGGKLQLTSTTSNPKITINGNEGNNSYVNNIYSGGIKVEKNNIKLIELFGATDGSNSWGALTLKDSNGTSTTNIDYNFIYSAEIKTDNLIQSSLEEKKKNFEKLQNGLDIIKATEIYKYNLKSQADGDKKHIGFVIGENYKYSNEITALDNKGKEVGADTYSMISVAYKAIQEQQEQIEQLQEKDKQKDEIITNLIKRIETLEKEVNNGKDNI